MTPSRKGVYAALAARLKANLVTTPVTSFAFVTVEPKLRDWDSVPGAEMPYLGIAMSGGERTEPLSPVHLVPTRWHLLPTGWLYVRTQGDRGDPQPILTDALDAIEAALVPDVGQQFQTLGGLVYSARLQGIVETDEGSLGALAVAHVHFEVVVDSGGFA